MRAKRPVLATTAGRVIRPRDRYLPPIISVASVIVVVVLVERIVVRAEQWPRIKAQFFSFDAIVEVFPKVLSGFAINMSVWAVALVVIGLWALVLAILRSLHGPWFTPLRVFVVVYIDLFGCKFF